MKPMRITSLIEITMLTLNIDLSATEDALHIQMPNGEEHWCTEDRCDCDGARFGNLCRHRLFIFAMGGFESLKKIILSERRKAQRTNCTHASTNLSRKDTNCNEHQPEFSEQVP